MLQNLKTAPRELNLTPCSFTSEGADPRFYKNVTCFKGTGTIFTGTPFGATDD